VLIASILKEPDPTLSTTLSYHHNSIEFSGIFSSLFQWNCKNKQPYDLFWTRFIKECGC